MISVIIPTLNAQDSLPGTLTALVPAAVEGLVREVIIVDGGSTDRTLRIADASGAEITSMEPGRGPQLHHGVSMARASWLLFLHADTELELGWEREVAHFMDRIEQGRRRQTAAVFRFALDDEGAFPRTLEAAVTFRTWAAGLPFGDQGLLIPRALYDEIGGYRPLPLMEDVDIARRLGRRRIAQLRSRAVTSPARYQKEGYFGRVMRNQLCLAMYYLGFPMSMIVKTYYGGKPKSETLPEPSRKAS